MKKKYSTEKYMNEKYANENYTNEKYRNEKNTKNMQMSSWHKLFLISLVAKAILKCSDLMSTFLGYIFFSKHFLK